MIATKRFFPLRTTALLAAVATTLALTGCGMSGSGGTTKTTPGGAPAARMNGSVQGGQQPVSGASIQIYAVGATGIGSAATALASAPSLSDGSGHFNFPAGWNCTSNTAVYGTNPQIYLVASGGNPGLGGTVNNQALVLMAALGTCSSITTSSFINVNELTTVAAVYALAPFMSNAQSIGAQGMNAPGLVNAFAVAATLADVGAGRAPGPGLPSNGTAPTVALNTLADVISVCVNSNGSDANCQSLFTAATPSGGSAPTNTVTALLNIAHSPGNSVTALYNMVTPAPPFQPVLTSAPNDWTMALNFTGGGLNSPVAVAIDATGNAWFANSGGNSVTELSGTGLPLTGASGYTGSNNIFGAQGLAIDRVGNVWVADALLSTVVELNVVSGAVQSSTSFTAGSISGPTGVAIDSQNNVWVSNFAGGSVTELTSAGLAVGNSPLTAAGEFVSPTALAIDASGNVWIADSSTSLLTKFSTQQSELSGGGFTDGVMVAPTGIAFDANGRAWVADAGTNSVSLFSPAGASVLSTPITGGGLNMPAAIAIDGSGTAWVANTTSVTEILAGASGPASPATGLGVVHQAAGIAVDASGGVWTANAADNSATLFVGLAAPAVTPVAAQAGP